MKSNKENFNQEIETHPWPAFIPQGAKVLIMGTFPPQPKRWSMKFYYPNKTNDFWYMMGLLFYSDKNALIDPETKLFRLDEIKQLLTDRHIAMNDTGYRIRRAMGNASDKYLEILEPVDLPSLLQQLPELTDIATTGEKAADTLAMLTGTKAPKMGEYVEYGDIRIWRMPSTSRAYPLALDKKAAYYSKLFKKAAIL